MVYTMDNEFKTKMSLKKTKNNPLVNTLPPGIMRLSFGTKKDEFLSCEFWACWSQLAAPVWEVLCSDFAANVSSSLLVFPTHPIPNVTGVTSAGLELLDNGVNMYILIILLVHRKIPILCKGIVRPSLYKCRIPCPFNWTTLQSWIRLY